MSEPCRLMARSRQGEQEFESSGKVQCLTMDLDETCHSQNIQNATGGNVKMEEQADT